MLLRASTIDTRGRDPKVPAAAGGVDAGWGQKKTKKRRTRRVRGLVDTIRNQSVAPTRRSSTSIPSEETDILRNRSVRILWTKSQTGRPSCFKLTGGLLEGVCNCPTISR